VTDDDRDGRLTGAEAVRSAREALQELTGKEPETVSGLSRDDDGSWTISLDVVELSRVPSTTDVLATYEIALDREGELVDMHRAKRYLRNQSEEE
jgi:hypothetical protein